jgi:hypothetical protein
MIEYGIKIHISKIKFKPKRAGLAFYFKTVKLIRYGLEVSKTPRMDNSIETLRL